MLYMELTETEKRSLSLKLFTSPIQNRENIIEMVKDGGNYLYQLSQDYNYNNWSVIMDAWFKIALFKKDNEPYANELEDGQILVDEMKIGSNGARITAHQSKDSKWVVDAGDKWNFITWCSFHIFVDGKPELSNSNSFQDSVYKTVTDFTIFWMEENYLL